MNTQLIEQELITRLKHKMNKTSISHIMINVLNLSRLFLQSISEHKQTSYTSISLYFCASLVQLNPDVNFIDSFVQRYLFLLGMASRITYQIVNRSLFQIKTQNRNRFSYVMCGRQQR